MKQIYIHWISLVGSSSISSVVRGNHLLFCWSSNNYLYFSVGIVFLFVLTLIGGDDKIPDTVSEELRDDVEMAVNSCENSAVFSSLPSAIKWLRDSVRHNQSVRFQVIGT